MNRHQPQAWRQPGLSEYLQRRPLVCQQSLWNSEEDADHALPATGTAHCTVVTVDDNGFTLVAMTVRLAHFAVLSMALKPHARPGHRQISAAPKLVGQFWSA
jgi:hypothetical protein